LLREPHEVHGRHCAKRVCHLTSSSQNDRNTPPQSLRYPFPRIICSLSLKERSSSSRPASVLPRTNEQNPFCCCHGARLASLLCRTDKLPAGSGCWSLLRPQKWYQYCNVDTIHHDVNNPNRVSFTQQQQQQALGCPGRGPGFGARGDPFVIFYFFSVVGCTLLSWRRRRGRHCNPAQLLSPQGRVLPRRCSFQPRRI
jgi:hypothetical protein